MSDDGFPAYFEVPTDTYDVTLATGAAFAIKANRHRRDGELVRFERWRVWGLETVATFGAASIASLIRRGQPEVVAPDAGRCATCTHWDQSEGRGPWEGECGRINGMRGWGAVIEPTIEDIDDGGVLVTNADFGCTLHEPSAPAPHPSWKLL